jgi:pyruvate dehydrogenase E1 component alpha subunit
VREAMKWAKDYALKNGPLFVEFDTYRYHGHSMSDPGITYRSRDEIMDIRKNRDPIEIVRAMILKNKWAEEAELKTIEKDFRTLIEGDAEKIKNDPEPTFEDLYSDVGVTHHPIRGVELGLSRW